MSKVVKGHPPLVELIAKKLSGIEGVPKEEMSKMVYRACFAAQEWYDRETEKCACGPWHDSKDEPPPRDKKILAEWRELDLVAVVFRDGPFWAINKRTLITSNNPDRWAEIREMK